jgi:hypothetical protein
MQALMGTKIDFFLVDADAKSNEKLCDELEIDELPHSQIIDHNGKILLNMLGVRTPEYIIERMEEQKKKWNQKK